MMDSSCSEMTVEDTCVVDNYQTGNVDNFMLYDYAKEYIKREEENMLQSCRVADDFDTVSVFTDSTTPVKVENDAQKQQINHICRTYNTPYRENKKLSITSMKKEIMGLIDTNSVVVIQGPTGCGKTTQIPQFIFDHAIQKREHCNIIVTQPRRIAAISISKRISSERDWPLGTLVGYKVGMLNCTSKDTRITLCTTGVLLRRLISCKHLLDFTHIVLDEIHERDQDMDFLLIVIRKLLWMNSRSVKIILMSATINGDKFSKYFASPLNGTFLPAPIIKIDKRSCYNVTKYYIDDIKTLGPPPKINGKDPRISYDLNKFCVDLIISFDNFDANERDVCFDDVDNNRHVVLIFLPGIWEIEELNNILQQSQYEYLKWDIVVLHSTITNEEQQRVFELPPKKHRRIILSTNIAESSVTVPNVKYVIDFCLTKRLVVDTGTHFRSLELTWASKASCEQRAGRTGRMMNGKVFRLVTNYIYECEFREETLPEILRAPLENLVLHAKLLEMGEPKAILALSIDPPDITNLENTVLLLKEVGALLNSSSFKNPLDGEITRLGYLMATLPVNIHVAKLIVLGHIFGVLRNAIIIGASMSTKNMFSNPFKNRSEAYNAKLNWSSGCWSDLITYLHAFQMWMAEKANRNINNKQSERNWARRHFIQLRVMYEIQALVAELTDKLKQEGITIPLRDVGKDKVSDFEEALLLKVIIAGAFYPNYFVSVSKGDQKEERDVIKALSGLDPTTTVCLHGWSSKQNGLLYAQRFQDLFKNCTRNSTRRIRINFNTSTRVYITFPHTTKSINQNLKSDESLSDVNVNGKIPISIYKALRLRRNKEQLSIPILADNEAEKLADEQKLPSNYSLREIWSPVVKPRLPGVNVKCIPIEIKNVNDPGNFWAVLDDADTKHAWDKIMTYCNNYCLTETVKEKPALGSMVLARHVNEHDLVQYYRATVENYLICGPITLMSVLLIDIGISIEAEQSDLRQFKAPNIATEIPALAFQCALVNIRPSVYRNINSHWIPDSFDEFSKLIAKGKLCGEIYSIVNNIVILNLYNVQGSTKMSINDILIKKGYAMYKVESYLSRQNHDIRQNSTDLSSEQLNFYNKSQYDEDYVTLIYPEPPAEKRCTRMINLRGPFSPLEIELSHLVMKSEGKQVFIENSSVNSVLLDPNPEEFQRHLVVAGSVSQTANGKQIILRNTTLMPNIRGLTTLLSLIFAPRLELRCSKLGNRYKSAVCGLGVNALTKNVIFRDHDMEVKFDVEIDNNDMFLINKLRHWMSTSLLPSEKEDLEEEHASVCQSTCRKLLMEIFEKDRKLRNLERCPEFGKWGICDESKILSPGNIDMKTNNIYPLHYAMELTHVDPHEEELLYHLDDLNDIVTDNPKINEEIKCLLCEVEVFGVMELRTHMSSYQHLKKASELRIKYNMNPLIYH